MTATPTKHRVRAHRVRMKEQGLVEVRVWVPKTDTGKVRAFAEDLRGKGAQQKTEDDCC